MNIEQAGQVNITQNGNNNTIVNGLPTRAIPPIGASQKTFARNGKIFIVHGHNNLDVLELKDYLQNTLGYPEPTVLSSVPGMNRTVIEAFEEEAVQSSLVFVLMTPDDPQPNGKFRARQNVVFELGYFFGRLNRRSGRTIILLKGDVEIPSDIESVLYIRFDNGIRAAGENIRRAMDVALENE